VLATYKVIPVAVNSIAHNSGAIKMDDTTMRTELLSSESNADAGVTKEIHITPERWGKVHVVLSATRREIWLYDVVEDFPKLIIKHGVPADAITTVVSLKIAKKPFYLWVTNIQGEVGTLGHLTVHEV